MTEHAQVSRAALTILGTRVAIYPIKIVIGLTIATLLGTTNYGIYAFLVLPGSVLTPLMAFGLGAGIRYYISNDEYQARDVAFVALLLGLINGAISALLFGGLWRYDLLGETGRAISFDVLYPILLVLPLQGVTLFMNRIVAGASWFSALNLNIFLINVAPPVFLLVFVIIGGQSLSGAVMAIVWATTIPALVTTIMVVFRYRPRLRIDVGFLRKASRYGIKAWVGALAGQTSARFDQFVLGFVQSPDALGVYRIAVMIAELLWIIPDAVNIPLFNRVSRTDALTDRLSVVMRSNRILILLISILSIGVFLIAWWTIPIFLGPEYMDARWLLGILLPGALALVTGRFLGMFFNSSGMPEKASFIQVVGAVASMVGYLTLIPLLGVAGAALATTASYILIALTARFMFAREARPHPIRLYRATADDLRWAAALVHDSFSIWRSRIKRAT